VTGWDGTNVPVDFAADNYSDRHMTWMIWIRRGGQPRKQTSSWLPGAVSPRPFSGPAHRRTKP